MPACACLAADAAALYIYQDVEFCQSIGNIQGLFNHEYQAGVGKILFNVFTVNSYLTAAFPKIYTGNGGFTTSGTKC